MRHCRCRPKRNAIATRLTIRAAEGSDVALDDLTAVIGSVKILEHGYASLLSRNGMILAHPVGELIMNDTFFSIAEARQDPAMRKLPADLPPAKMFLDDQESYATNEIAINWNAPLVFVLAGVTPGK